VVYWGVGAKTTPLLHKKEQMQTITFPNGQAVQVDFDEQAHSYVVGHQLADGAFSDWRPTHGITAPLVVTPKPFLVPWGAKEGVHALLEHFYKQPATVEKLPQFFVDLEAYENNVRNDAGKPVMSYYRFNKAYPWYKECKAAYKVKSQEGKELGTWLHSAIENFYRSGRKTLPIITPDVEGMWESFTQFDNYYKPIPDADGLEFLVYSLMFGYSGQGDFRGRMSGKYCIGDWKSTNRSQSNPDGIDVDYFFQLGGLAQAEFERTGKWVEDVFAANFDKKGEEPRVIWASDFGASPQDCAKGYVSCFNNYHTIETWDYRFRKR
jgi:hypothetical protein